MRWLVGWWIAWDCVTGARRVASGPPRPTKEPQPEMQHLLHERAFRDALLGSRDRCTPPALCTLERIIHGTHVPCLDVRATMHTPEKMFALYSRVKRQRNRVYSCPTYLSSPRSVSQNVRFGLHF